MPMAYTVEKLLALRDSVSESAVSIDKFPDEDVIKEHVIRPTVSANIIRTASTASFEKPVRASATAAGVSAAATNLKKPSPSPSVKRGKAERLLKEHGSPPGMRVTAGGRVVPSDLPPLNSGARFGSSNTRAPRPRSVDPNTGLPRQSQAENLNAQLRIIGTQPVIQVGDRIYPIQAYEGGYAMHPAVPTPVVPPVVDPTKQAGFPTPLFAPSLPGPPWIPQNANAQVPLVANNVQVLQEHYENKRAELRQLEQLEVIEGERQGQAWRSSVIAKKRSLIVELDAVRKQINAMKESDQSKEEGGSDPVQTTSVGSSSTVPAPAPNAFVPPFHRPLPPVMFANMGVPYVSTPSPFQLMYPAYGPTAPPPYPTETPQFGSVPDNLNNGELLGKCPALENGYQINNGHTQGGSTSHSPSSTNRRSHAVPIKKPDDDGKKNSASASRLDPKSPTYEPVSKMTGTNKDSGSNQAPSTPSPVKESPWHTNGTGVGQLLTQKDRGISQKPSLSSISTTDFFPTNTHEHSSTRIAPEKLPKQPSRDTTKLPATPDKPWSNGPWNPPSGGQSSRAGSSTQNDSTMKLTSWPEVFGKQSPVPGSGHKPRADGTGAPLSSNTGRSDSGGQNSAELNWPGIASEPVVHPPSTYQEGFQAGLCHTGLPEAPDVLRGYVAGLLTLLDKNVRTAADCGYTGHLFTNNHDGETSSARSSLQGYLPGAMAHDSGINFTENMRSAKVNSLHLGQTRTPVYGPRANEHSVQMTYAQGVDAPRDGFMRGPSNGGNFDGYRQRVPVSHNQVKKGEAQIDLALSVHPPLSQKFSGNQMGNRSYGTPDLMQRFFPAAKEHPPEVHKTETGHGNAMRASGQQRLSGLDGAVDDLEGLVVDAQEEEKGVAGSSDSAEADASCFKPSCGKGKQAASTAAMSNSGTTSPSKTTSPRKAGEHSPAKARLEQVTSKLRRPKKEDVGSMSAEEKQKRTEKWGKRFRQIKTREEKDIERYMRENPRRDSEEGACR
ncbi:uncharacterized protein EI97DRAFT_458697 [Westerdykella ornata]|uniref:Uncharacterized protein n=1 Tax=Westerdykella ornata TaxID=318751 RepID=A0A6A6JHS6_WESOR|nr:uncharacterized protein EI97DRAFT_458697 [Westerdykella ornata]KAF2276210.1 hypothetical protein EI97DRAFT_458697 [Westerdykella ornata]